MRLRRRARTSTATEAAPQEHPTPPSGPEVAERGPLERARAEREEAQRELARLRERFWSGERLLEESKTDLPWWEHPEADPYAVLDLLPGASIEEAAAARRAIALRCHPDRADRRHATEAARRHMVAANAAYDRLRRALLPV